MEVPSESFKGELGIQEPVIHGEPQIFTVNRWLVSVDNKGSWKTRSAHTSLAPQGPAGASGPRTCDRVFIFFYIFTIY
jgi:hypothetical protein